MLALTSLSHRYIRCSFFSFSFCVLLTRVLRKAIPEFHSHVPTSEVHPPSSWGAMPRRIAERSSPSFRSARRVSQSPSSVISETSTSMPVFPPSQRPRASAAPPVPILDVPLTVGPAVNNSSDSAEARHDVPSYTLPPSTVDQRRINAISSASPPYGVENRQNPYLPPVASLTPSRGSSFDTGSPERPQQAMTLPSLFAHPTPVQAPQRDPYVSLAESDMRYQPPPQDQHPRYSGGASTSTTAPTYRAPSPGGGSHASPHYYHASSPFTQPARSASYAPAPQIVAENRSPFSSRIYPSEMTIDHFDHGRPGKRRRGNLPKHVTDLLRGWLNDHLHHPYPTEDEKQLLMQQTGLNINQVSFCIALYGYG